MQRAQPFLLLLATLALGGCHTGLEVAGVKSAYANRTSDGRVTIVATLECQLVQGRGRSEGCDADDSNVCLEARWYDASDKELKNVRFQAKSCSHQATIEGAKMEVTSDVAIPKMAYENGKDLSLKVWVQADPRGNHGSGRYPQVLLYSP